MIGENFGRPIEIGISFSSNEDDITQYGVQRGMPAERIAGRANGGGRNYYGQFPMEMDFEFGALLPAR